MSTFYDSVESVRDHLSIIPLEEEDEPAVQYEQPLVEDAEIDTRWSLVGRFLTEAPIDFMAMQNLMAVLWKPGMGMYVKDLGENKFIFQFYHEIDIQRVVDRSPWTFKNAPLIFERLKPGDVPRAVRLNHLEIWVQLHDVQSGFKTEKMVTDAGNYIGSFVKSDEKNFNGVWRDYLRVRVRIDIEKPLKRRMKLQQIGGDWFWINFRYEFVPTFCFICGIIGHTENYCSRLFIQSASTIVKPYGTFMKAVPRKTQYAMGAKWLRSGSSSYGGHGGSVAAGGGSVGRESFQGNHGFHGIAIPGFSATEVGGDMINDNGRNLGKQSGELAGSKEGDIYGNIVARQVESISNLDEEGLLFMDNKRKRLGKEVDIGPSGLKEGLDMDIGPDSNTHSKNVTMASSTDRARQSL
ncbi:hypothetical protein CsatA_019722 [Cannabis sativa]